MGICVADSNDLRISIFCFFISIWGTSRILTRKGGVVMRKIKCLFSVVIAVCLIMMLPLKASAESLSEDTALSGVGENTQLTDEEAYKLYEEYLEKEHLQLQVQSDKKSDSLERFVNYAVRENIIEDTPLQRDGLQKSVVRGAFKTVVAAGNAYGYKVAAFCLDHSLQDRPSNLSYGSSSDYALKIQHSTEYNKVLNDFMREARSSSKTNITKTGAVSFTSDNDLYLAFHSVDYVATGIKSNGRWTVLVTFTDRYNFEAQDWKNNMTDYNAVTVINNYAAHAQNIGAIVPYNIKIVVKKIV